MYASLESWYKPMKMMRKTLNTSGPKQQSGFAILLVSAILLLSATMLSFVLAGSTVTMQRSVGNEYRMSQAFSAAQAGVEYSIAYMSANYATLADGQTITDTLADGSSYSSVLTYLNGKDLVKLTSTGNSADNSSNRVISQVVSYQSSSGGTSIPPLPIKAVNRVKLKDSAKIHNYENDDTTLTGRDIRIKNSAKTYLDGGESSNSSSIGSDVVEYDAATAALTSSKLQIATLGKEISEYQSSATHTYSASSHNNYSSQLDGLTGTIIWISQTNGYAKLDGSIVVGSAANPVTIFVDGKIKIKENVKIYGNIIATGKIKLRGSTEVRGLVFSAADNKNLKAKHSVKVWGAVISAKKVKVYDSAEIYYDSAVLNSTLANILTPGSSAYAKVPGSWNDMGL